MDIIQNSIGALFDEDERAGEAIADLIRSGVSPGSLGVAAHSAGRSRVLTERFHVQPIDVQDRSRAPLTDLLSPVRRGSESGSATFVAELRHRGLDSDRAEHFANALGEGVLVILDARDVTPERVTVLIRAGADLGLANAGGIEHVVPLRAETLDVRKAVVVTNEVSVSTEIIKEIKTYDIELTREEFVIRRKRLGVQGAPEIETLRIPLRHEEVVIDKRTIVTEEVTVHTEQVVDVQHIEETLRHEVLRVTDAALDERVYDTGTNV